MPLALCICVMFIPLVQSVNGAQLSKYYFLSLLFEAATATAATDIVPLTSIYALP